MIWKSVFGPDSDDPGEIQDSSLLAVGLWAGCFTLLQLSPEPVLTG